MADDTRRGRDGSTCVRTTRMVLAGKGCIAFRLVALDGLAGEPQTAGHRERRPFGEVPVLDCDETPPGARVRGSDEVGCVFRDVAAFDHPASSLSRSRAGVVVVNDDRRHPAFGCVASTLARARFVDRQLAEPSASKSVAASGVIETQAAIGIDDWSHSHAHHHRMRPAVER